MVSDLSAAPAIDLKRVVGDKQLARVDVEAALFKRDRGLALTLKELAVVSGYNYTYVRDWAAGRTVTEPLPMFGGQITWSEFLVWKRGQQRAKSQAGESPAPDGPATRALRRRSTAAKSS